MIVIFVEFIDQFIDYSINRASLSFVPVLSLFCRSVECRYNELTVDCIQIADWN